MKFLSLILGLSTLQLVASAANMKEVQSAAVIESQLRDGDIIFIKSKSSQSAALREATNSQWTHMGVMVGERGRWFVNEASSTVKLTPVKDFISSSAQNHFIVRRVRPEVSEMNASDVRKLKVALSSFFGKSYDRYFEWSNSKIYCSELVFKAYYESLNIQIGSIQKLKELTLNGPAVKKLIQDRIVNEGRELNIDEPIVTPVSMLNSGHLKTIQQSL